jgi:hypothetical protein
LAHCSSTDSLQGGTEEYYYNDLANNLRTGHMDLTFQPTYLAMPYRDFRHPVAPAVHGATGRNVFNMIGEEESDEGGNRSWHNTLRLERGFETSPDHDQVQTLSSSPGYDSLRSGLGDAFGFPGANKRIRFVSAVSYPGDAVASAPVSAAEASRPVSTPGFNIEEDIGVMEDAGPLLGSNSSFQQSVGGSGVGSTGLHEPAPPQFSVPKPGLKSVKRSGQRGKGVMGAVLATDGSVTHEPSRML